MHVSPRKATTDSAAESRLPRHWSRSHRDALLMAMISYALVLHRRGSGEPWSVIISEAGCLVIIMSLAAIAAWVQPKVFGAPMLRWVTKLLVLGCLLPTLSRFAVISYGGNGTAWEMVMLTTLGIAAISLVIAGSKRRAPKQRDIPLSVVCSGFLTLFTTAISDNASALYYAIAWLVICLYWMIANHWERLEVHMAQSVHRTRSLRLSTTVAGVGVAMLAMFATMGREPATRLIQWGIMPTSGGREWTDPSARSGVGDGDAVVAAKDHASSFGPVDSGIFLQSDLPSLFDMFDDTLGEIVLKKRSDKAVALPNQQPTGEEQKFAQSQQGSASFSIAREPKKETRTFKDKISPAAFQWIGPTGISVAMERFNRFDGTQWQLHTAADAKQSIASPLISHTIDQMNWICHLHSLQANRLEGPARVDAVKFINLQTPRIPVASGTMGVQIKDVDRIDFFQITADDCWLMPGRVSIPALTVVNILSRDLDGDRVAMANFASHQDDPADLVSPAAVAGNKLAHELATQWTTGVSKGWPAIHSVITHLREEFQFDRAAVLNPEAPLTDFLSQRRGGDHLFATAATVMLQSIGYRARLVSGFYIDPEQYDRFAGHTSVTSRDVHVWSEVQTDEGVWVPLEPTPGYQEPRLYRSLWSRTCQFAWTLFPWLIASAAVIALLWKVRAIWGEWLCLVGWFLSAPWKPETRIKWLVRLLDCRSRLAGNHRPAGITPSRWFQGVAAREDDELWNATSRFFANADRLCYSPQAVLGPEWNQDAHRLATTLTVKRMRRSAHTTPI